jgi:hypothetical protein
VYACWAYSSHFRLYTVVNLALFGPGVCQRLVVVVHALVGSIHARLCNKRQAVPERLHDSPLLLSGCQKPQPAILDIKFAARLSLQLVAQGLRFCSGHFVPYSLAALRWLTMSVSTCLTVACLPFTGTCSSLLCPRRHHAATAAMLPHGIDSAYRPDCCPLYATPSLTVTMLHFLFLFTLPNAGGARPSACVAIHLRLHAPSAVNHIGNFAR